jgi:preprotein translocase subunit SecG
MNPDLGHHKNTCKPPLPKPYLSHQITKTRDASQTQKNLEKHTNIPAFFFFLFSFVFPINNHNSKLNHNPTLKQTTTPKLEATEPL